MKRAGSRSTTAVAAATRKEAAKESAAAAASLAAMEAEKRIAAEEARRRFTRIDSFEGAFDFLSLDAHCVVSWDGKAFPTARHALLAAQYPEAATEIAEAPVDGGAAAAQKAAEKAGVPEADEWSMRRPQVLERILRDKFRRSADFRKRLEETGDRDLVWETTEDGFWGSSRGRGQNHLGRALMDVRKSLQEGTEFESWLFLCCEMESEDIKRPPVELLEQKQVGGDEVEAKQVHRLSGSGYFKLGKLESSAVVARHPSVSREHAMLVHTRAACARSTGGLAILDMGSKAGTSVGGRQLSTSFVLEPLRNGDVIKLGASTRTYTVRVNLQSQIDLLEQQERELMREVKAIDADAADPIQAAKRAAREEATVFVGNLDYETEKADLLGLFMDCGSIAEVRFPGHEATKATRGICFVVFEDAISARRACGLSGEPFKGRRVKVAPASENRKVGEDEGGKGKGKGKGKSKAKGDNAEGDGSPARRRPPSPNSPEKRRSRSRRRGGQGRHDRPSPGRRRFREDGRSRSRDAGRREEVRGNGRRRGGGGRGACSEERSPTPRRKRPLSSSPEAEARKSGRSFGQAERRPRAEAAKKGVSGSDSSSSASS